jgi:hypothetical protein
VSRCSRTWQRLARPTASPLPPNRHPRRAQLCGVSGKVDTKDAQSSNARNGASMPLSHAVQYAFSWARALWAVGSVQCVVCGCVLSSCVRVSCIINHCPHPAPPHISHICARAGDIRVRRVENGSAMDLYSAARAVPLRDLVLSGSSHEAAMAVRRFRFSSACGGMSVYRAGA